MIVCLWVAPVIEWRPVQGVYRAFRPLAVRIGSISPVTLNWIKLVYNMDGSSLPSLCVGSESEEVKVVVDPWKL